MLGKDDHDGRAVQAQLVKARTVWARISNILQSKNTLPCICDISYKAVVQAILLYGSETWCLSPTLLVRLKGFHIKAAHQMAHEHWPRKDSQGV